jgi:hypothetical protein
VVEPMFGKVVTEVKGLNNNKAPRANEVTVKLLKFGREVGLMFVHECIFRTWCSGKALEDRKQAQIVILHKSDSLANLDNYRGISFCWTLSTRCILGCFWGSYRWQWTHA